MNVCVVTPQGGPLADEAMPQRGRVVGPQGQARRQVVHVNCEQGLRRSTAKIKGRWEEDSPSGEGSGVCGFGVVTLGTLTAGAPAGGGTWKAFLSAPGMGGWRMQGEGVPR